VSQGNAILVSLN